MGQRERIVEIAMSQVGYHEGANNDNKYGEWYGMNNEPWCDIFVSWCAAMCGISEDIIPKRAYVPDTANWFSQRDEYKNSISWGGNYTPQKGDLILFDYDRTSISDHIGIVGSVDKNRVFTIEGNKDNEVKYCAYDLDDKSIRAYCVPAYYEPKPERNKDIKKYINKNSETPVYADTYLRNRIGTLAPNEECECYEVFEDRAVVFYQVNGTLIWKVGYTDYIDGVQ